MDVREARSEDAAAIRRVARDSYAASYGAVLDEAAIDRIVEAEFGEDRLETLGEDADATLLVAATDDDADVAGLADGALVDGDPVVGDVRWIHVDPDRRGEDLGARLLGELVRRFETNDAAVVRGHVVEGNDAGGDFFESYGFERESTATVTIAGEDYEETVYEHRTDAGVGEEVVESVAGPDGETLFVDFSAAERGTLAPIYPVFADESLSERYGWRCGNCGSMETTMDSAGRVQCAACDNARAATRWDGSYL